LNYSYIYLKYVLNPSRRCHIVYKVAFLLTVYIFFSYFSDDFNFNRFNHNIQCYFSLHCAHYYLFYDYLSYYDAFNIMINLICGWNAYFNVIYVNTSFISCVFYYIIYYNFMLWLWYILLYNLLNDIAELAIVNSRSIIWGTC